MATLAGLSLCLIAKNEEGSLAACLGSAADLIHELIVIDTGSTDRTKEVAASFGARVFDFAWCDDFSAARNESLRHATGDWIFWLDADDRLDEENRQKLRKLFAGLKDENAAYVMKSRSIPSLRTPLPQGGEGSRVASPLVGEGKGGGAGSAVDVDHVRLFRNHPDMRWQYRVHEQSLPALRRLGADIRWTDIVAMGLMLAYNQFSSNVSLQTYNPSPAPLGDAGGMGRQGAQKIVILETDGLSRMPKTLSRLRLWCWRATRPGYGTKRGSIVRTERAVCRGESPLEDRAGCPTVGGRKSLGRTSADKNIAKV